MYSEVSAQYREAIKKRNIISVAYLRIIDDNTIIPISDISKVILKDYCNDNGKIIGTAMTKELEFVLYNNSNYDLQNKEVEFRYGLKIGNNYEYIPYGNFIVASFKDTKSSNKYQVIAYDYMQKLNEDYIDNNTYPTTMWNWYKNFCKFYGIEYVDQYNELPNVDFNITQAPVFEGRSGRVALARIAEMFGSFAKFNRENKLQMYLSTETNEKIEYSSLNTKLEINNIFNKINTVSLELGGGVEGENVVKSKLAGSPRLDVNPKTGRLIQFNLPEDERILRIIDNPFLYSQAKREEAIDGIFERVYGFRYVPMFLQYIGRFYLDCGDQIKVYDKYGRTYTTIVMNQYLEIPATRKCSMKNEALTENELKYRYYSNTEQARRHTELLVDKQNQIIQGLITKTELLEDTFIGQTSEIKQTVNSISLTVSETTGKVENLETDISGKVNKTEVISAINLSKEGITIKGSKISLEGVITANETFKINTSGSIECIGGKVGGFNIDQNALYSNHVGITSNPSSFQNYAFWAGASTANIGSAPFRVTSTGNVYSNSINLETSVFKNNIYPSIIRMTSAYGLISHSIISDENAENRTASMWQNVATGKYTSITEEMVRTDGFMYSKNFINTSEASQKENIKEFNDSALNIISNTNIYQYNFIGSQAKNIGLVIGDNYKDIPNEILRVNKIPISNFKGNKNKSKARIMDIESNEIDNNITYKESKGVDLYSMCSLAWKAIQELNKKIEKITINGGI